MKTVHVHDAEGQLAQLLDDVAAGESITIMRHGVPVAQLVPPSERRADVARAIEAWIAYRNEHNITLGDDLTIRDLIEDGRR